MAPESGVRVDLSGSDVQITPTSLTFGYGDHQAPVEKNLKEELTLKNTRGNVVFAFVSPLSASLKFRVKVNMQGPFVLHAGEEVKVPIFLRILCTTKRLRIEISVKTWT